MNKFSKIFSIAILCFIILFTFVAIVFSEQEQQSIFFGSYMNNDTIEPIEWIVLDEKDDRILIISRYLIDMKVINSYWGASTWNESELRLWLNTDFLYSSFTDYEQTCIYLTQLPESINPQFNTKVEGGQFDYIFFLSYEEFTKYFSNGSGACQPTIYAYKHGVYKNLQNGCSVWWLRTPGNRYTYTMVVYSDGSVYYHGYYNIGSRLTSPITGIRPAMWVSKDIFNKI